MDYEKTVLSRVGYLRRHRFFFLVLCAAAISVVSAATFYVAPDGRDSNSGIMDEPFGSLEKGAGEAQAGDTVYLRGGTFAMNKAPYGRVAVYLPQPAKVRS